MIEKHCVSTATSGYFGHLVHPGYDEDLRLIKTGEISNPAAEHLRAFIRTLSSQEGQVWALLSALGAGEFWGSNSNGDFFTHAGLVHTPKGWHEMSPALQRIAGPKWEWGYPTFYGAGVYRHHQNKDVARSFGKIHYVYWDPYMKRVLLVVLLDRHKAQVEGAIGIIDKIENGEFPPLSMGCRVPFDLCARCTDWSRITGNPQRDLAEHRRKPIRGLSVTTVDYCFPPGTPILLADGTTTPIEEVRVGEHVLTAQGNARRVVHTMQRDVNENVTVLNVTGLHGELVLTNNHPCFVIREADWARGHMSRTQQKSLGVSPTVNPTGETTPQELPASEMRPGDRVVLPIPRDEEDLGLPDSLVSLLGWYLAQGYVPKSGNRRQASRKWYNVELTHDSLKRDHIAEIVSTAEALGLRTDVSPNKGKQAVTVTIYGEWFAEQCVAFCGRGSRTKRLAEEVMKLPPRQQLLLLQAYAKGDGSVSDEAVRLVTTSDDLASQLPLLLARCGMVSHVQLDERETNYGHQRNWFVAVPSFYAEPLGGTSPNWSNSKTRISGDYVAYRVKDVRQEHYTGPVYNLEVEEDHSYVAGGIAVHNCQHLQFERNTIYPDGVRACMLNLHPKFFDISFVFVGADKTSYMLAKLAGKCPIRPEKSQCSGGCRDCAFGSAQSLSL